MPLALCPALPVCKQKRRSGGILRPCYRRSFSLLSFRSPKHVPEREKCQSSAQAIRLGRVNTTDDLAFARRSSRTWRGQKQEAIQAVPRVTSYAVQKLTNTDECTKNRGRKESFERRGGNDS
ncbi:hypothetical protein PHSY_005492 [Pseudozyma hubeiensis SY62]|uniref:Uncharacterized protein n=1 Tax=Pseudozyma hubeiensis (strain SY62) TaxID=1305764 RepID=R9P988_PSEHS|nr:hypothetical protein PHSY_005492 [Pseudozyma hubeiensis SY62]GAC97904.1 hypothetical protein PHSY_005492 [Pseudozyma hubeiensis SY62]